MSGHAPVAVDMVALMLGGFLMTVLQLAMRGPSHERPSSRHMGELVHMRAALHNTHRVLELLYQSESVA